MTEGEIAEVILDDFVLMMYNTSTFPWIISTIFAELKKQILRMKTWIKSFVFMISCLGLILLSGCSDDDKQPISSTDPEVDKPQKPEALPSESVTYRQFVEKSPENVLHDFSYAGYEHAEKAPDEASAWEAAGYQVFNVCDYGAVPNDKKSDREAFFKTLEAAGATSKVIEKDGPFRTIRFLPKKGANLNAIIYFPEGEFSLQCDKSEVNETIHLTMGHVIIRGAGRDKTILAMDLQNDAEDPAKMWSTPHMIEIKHYSAPSTLTKVTEDAPLGSHTVQVASALGVKPGDWVRLYLKNNHPDLVAQELAPHTAADLIPTASIIRNGVEIMDFHQVKSVSGQEVTFVEPLMHAVEAKWDWKLQKFPHYEQVGVEDLTFQGQAKEKFQHHGSAADDGGFKLINMTRLTNSWMRRVNFKSVSEALSVVNSANVSVYDIDISGNRGHSAIRSQGSSRVFIGKVHDHSDGHELNASGGHAMGGYMTNAGQYHACGVSKHSLGAVIWNVHWGDDSCFESHATQPRATLIDRCTGGFMQWREGGDKDQLPNHLDGLTIWNMNATRVKTENNPFIWWSSSSDGWWKNLPVIIVGFHGVPLDFDTSSQQMKRLESNGQAVKPASLYEAQLELRLGSVPAWLNALK